MSDVQAVQTEAPEEWHRPEWPKDALRISFGLIWLVDAILKWLPGFRSTYMDTIMGTAQGQPAWLKGWFDFWINLQHPHAMYFAYLVAVVETLIALALIFGFARKVTYLSAIVFSMLIWMTAEGFGGPYMRGSADVGTAIIYAVVFAALLALSYYAGASRWSADYYLEKRIAWWWKIAELREPLPAIQPTAPSAPNEDSAMTSADTAASIGPIHDPIPEPLTTALPAGARVPARHPTRVG